MPFKYPIRTRYSETAQDKIIHHSSYIVYLEVARLEFFKMLGCDINQLEGRGIFCPVVDLSIKYMKPLYSLEDIVVVVWIESISKARFSLGYRVLRGDVCALLAVVSHCFTNDTLKPIAIPKELLSRFHKYQTENKSDV